MMSMGYNTYGIIREVMKTCAVQENWGRAKTVPLEAQPRTQALSTTRLAGGKTLVQAGHVSPRFWDLTNFLHKGGGLSLFYRSSCRYQFDKVQSVCILTNARNFNERQELVLQNQWVRCLCICILCGSHLRRRYARSIRTGVFQFHLGKIAKNYLPC